MSAVGPEPLANLGLTPYQMHAVALEKAPEHRWLAKLDCPKKPVAGNLPKGVHLYVPMTLQLTNSGDAAPRNPR